MLSFLFTAVFEDGCFIRQTQDDVSSVDSSKSQFFDVLQKQERLVSFHLISPEKTISVNLLDGSFALDGFPFNAGDPRQHEAGNEYRLIFFRRHTHTTGTQSSHSVVYHIGYQWTDEKGTNHQQTLQVSK